MINILDSLLNTAPCGYFSVTAAGSIAAANNTLCKMLGYDPGSLVGKPVETILPVQAINLNGSRSASAHSVIIRLTAASGDQITVVANRATRRIEGGSVQQWVVLTMPDEMSNQQEIVEVRKELEEARRQKHMSYIELEDVYNALDSSKNALNEVRARLDNMTLVDELTQLKNRRSLSEILNFHRALADRMVVSMSVLLVNIDRFSTINETYGIEAGDQCLKELARVIENTVREVDIAVRFGGDEFVLVLPNTDQAGSFVAAEKVRKAVDATTIAGKKVTVSIGAATQKPGMDPSLDLVGMAGRGLSVACQRGGNQVVHVDTLE